MPGRYVSADCFAFLKICCTFWFSFFCLSFLRFFFLSSISPPKITRDIYRRRTLWLVLEWNMSLCDVHRFHFSFSLWFFVSCKTRKKFNFCDFLNMVKLGWYHASHLQYHSKVAKKKRINRDCTAHLKAMKEKTNGHFNCAELSSVSISHNIHFKCPTVSFV